MLENATAKISIEDLDYLRACDKELKAIKQIISLASDVQVDENEKSGEINGVTINVDAIVLKPLIYKYHDFSNKKNDWVNEQFAIGELKIVFK